MYILHYTLTREISALDKLTDDGGYIYIIQVFISTVKIRKVLGFGYNFDRFLVEYYTYIDINTINTYLVKDLTPIQASLLTLAHCLFVGDTLVNSFRSYYRVVDQKICCHFRHKRSQLDYPHLQHYGRKKTAYVQKTNITSCKFIINNFKKSQ